MGELRQRDPRVRDKAHLGRVAKLHCIICAIQGRRTWPVEVAHCKIGYPEAGWRAFGHSERAHDYKGLAPICFKCHHRTGAVDAQHRNPWGDERDWWERWGVYPPDFCQALVAAFSRGEAGDKVVESFAALARSACAGPRSMP
jgi:hypothetical protein